MTDKEKLEEIKQLADNMYNKMQNLTTDTSGIRKAMDDYHQFIIYQYYKEELLSEELEEAVDGYTRKVLERTNYLIGNQVVGKEISKAVKFGAEWQEEKDNEEKVLIYKHGFEDCKEQMIAKAIDAHCFGFQGAAALFTFTLPAGSYLVGSKVKVIVVKED